MIRQIDPQFLDVVQPSRPRIYPGKRIDAGERLVFSVKLLQRANKVVVCAVRDWVLRKSLDDLTKFLFGFNESAFVVETLACIEEIPGLIENQGRKMILEIDRKHRLCPNRRRNCQ